MEAPLDCSEQNRSLFLKQHPDYAECLSKKPPGKWRRKNSNLVREDQGKSYWIYAENRELEVSQWVIHQDLSYPTLLVYGVGLGAHYLGLLPWLRGDPKRKVIFVEDDLDIMQHFLTTPLATQLLQDEQADLFVVDLLFGVKTFEEIANKMVVQHVNFCAIEFYETYYQKQFSMIHYQILFFKEMIEFSLSECLTKGEWYFKHFYLNHIKVDQSFQGVKLFEQFKGVPAIICGAGPSLEKNIHLLGDLQEKALIFAGGSGMNVLNAHGIRPHFGFGVDPFDPQFTRMLMQTAFETPYFYLDRLHHRAFDLIQGPRIYLSSQGGYTVGDWYDRELNMECPKIEEGCNVINLSTVVAEKLGCNPIIFVGLDMAYTEGKSYAPGITTHAIHSTKTDRTTRRLTEEIILRPDVDGKQIQTLWKWEMESNWYALFSRLYPDVKLINATEGGIGMPTVPNVSLQEVIETQLTKQMPLSDWIHATLQQAALPEQVT
ncbi:MAG: motility associated factor glycosyltransferase family protein, partial [Chlamydiia bacterium]|nr:motility associated factor glycosyltransferase family protein [Chlamydiia bacterium]